MVVTRKGSFLATMALGGICAAIIMNAVVGQTGPHPAPIVVTKAERAAGPIVEALKDSYTARLTLAQFSRPDAMMQVSKQRDVVTGIQQQLSALGTYSGKVDGLLGPQTRDAISSYQRSNELRVDGEPSEGLLDHMRLNRRIARIAMTTVADPRIQLVQSGLSELGYSPGPVDGIVGEQTRDAIRKFQRDRRLPESGQISSALMDELRKVTGLSVLSALDAKH